jgi:hypothetical protein
MVASHARHFATGGRTGERLMALVEKGKAELMKPDAKLDVANPLAMFGTEAERCAVANHSDGLMPFIRQWPRSARTPLGAAPA